MTFKDSDDKDKLAPVTNKIGTGYVPSIVNPMLNSPGLRSVDSKTSIESKL